MFAIEITEDNLEKIFDTGLVDAENQKLMRDYPGKDRIFIRGYVATTGMPMSWIFFPGRIFRKKFDFDPVKIKTDWDQIVRKEN